MMAAVFDDGLKLVQDHPIAEPGPGWARIKVTVAGICKTDMEIMKGYLGFRGVLGHEFVGVVDRCDDPVWIGQRVVGEINAACGHCHWCAQGLGHHCPNRTTLGILNHDGCMAEFCTLPMENLFIVPADISNDQAVLTEPLSAACEILEQLPVHGDERVVVLGDGRLGILCAWALSTVVSDVTLVGRHPEKLRLAQWRGIRTCIGTDRIKNGADIVVEATGSGQGIGAAISLCRPRGTIVLKSTVAIQGDVNLAALVINELTLLGSRCGRFVDGLAMMNQFPDMPLTRMISARYPLSEVHEAFVRSQRRDVMKVLLDIAK
ncbi:MAG: alcohol dehydrogenase catalytic domain-containing protein [Deltaproteobacteria bacterium]|nr:alcohol dehydrogenase catalytic domain-containing protein [Deltaproteobacteria bacterium]